MEGDRFICSGEVDEFRGTVAFAIATLDWKQNSEGGGLGAFNWTPEKEEEYTNESWWAVVGIQESSAVLE